MKHFFPVSTDKFVSAFKVIFKDVYDVGMLQNKKEMKKIKNITSWSKVKHF